MFENWSQDSSFFFEIDELYFSLLAPVKDFNSS